MKLSCTKHFEKYWVDGRCTIAKRNSCLTVVGREWDNTVECVKFCDRHMHKRLQDTEEGLCLYVRMCL